MSYDNSNKDQVDATSITKAIKNACKEIIPQMVKEAMTNHNHDKAPDKTTDGNFITQADINDVFIKTNAMTAIHHVLNLTGPEDTNNHLTADDLLSNKGKLSYAKGLIVKFHME